ncbi:MAG: hypothetical protein AABX39_00245 [Nanoarchaeota archaeon]
MLKMKFNIIGFIILLAILLSACTKKEIAEVSFCQKLSKCEQASLEITDSTTKDIYELTVLGINENFCSTGLSLVEAHTEKLKPLEKSKAVCDQEWSQKFEKIASFDEQTCKKYVDSLTINLLTNIADEKSIICTGELRERLITPNKFSESPQGKLSEIRT